MANWPQAVMFGLAVLGAVQVMKALVSLLFCHCGKLNIWCWYTMRRALGKSEQR